MDPRIARTHESLKSALLDLCKTEDFHDLSISQIVEKAGVNRSTFYQHYADKETLLADALDDFAEAAQAQLDAAGPVGVDFDARDVILRYFEHVRDNVVLYRAVLSAAGSPVILERLADRITQLALRGLTQAKASGASGMPMNIVAASLAGSFIGIMREWINMSPLPSAERATDWAWITMTATRYE